MQRARQPPCRSPPHFAADLRPACGLRGRHPPDPHHWVLWVCSLERYPPGPQRPRRPPSPSTLYSICPRRSGKLRTTPHPSGGGVAVPVVAPWNARERQRGSRNSSSRAVRLSKLPCNHPIGMGDHATCSTEVALMSSSGTSGLEVVSMIFDVTTYLCNKPAQEASESTPICGWEAKAEAWFGP